MAETHFEIFQKKIRNELKIAEIHVNLKAILTIIFSRRGSSSLGKKKLIVSTINPNVSHLKKGLAQIDLNRARFGHDLV